MMNNLELTNEELDYLELLLHNHEYEEKDRKLIDTLEFKFYQVKEKESLRIKNILKAQSKQPKAEWQPLKCNPIEYSKTMHNFKEFLDYCESFYSPSHPDVLYPIDGLTRGELALATLNYLDLCAASDGTVSWGDGDSLDRERVRDFVINRRAIQ